MFQTFFIHLFIENIRKNEVYNTLKFWKTEPQTETENHVIYTHDYLRLAIGWVLALH